MWTLISFLLALPAMAAPAFPGAQGFGAQTPGGRGGSVVFVHNLNDAGPGSLRASLETKGPRIVLFRVAGIIHLNPFDPVFKFASTVALGVVASASSLVFFYAAATSNA